jgi:putative tricarboxylic transport membrane protein
VKLNDAVWGALLLVLSAAVFLGIRSFPNIPGQNVGPGAFPGLIATGLAGCAVILLVRGVRELRAGGRLLVFGEWLRSPRHVANFLLTCGAIVFYLLTVERLGFLVTATLLLLALFLQLKVKPWLAVVVAVAAAFAIHAAFYKLLRVSLPWGVLPILY